MDEKVVTAPTLAPPAGRELPEQGKWTYEDWLRLPDDGYRYEVINGVMHMAPPPSISEHQGPAFYMTLSLGNFVIAHNAGRVFFAPAGVRLPGQAVPVQPDIFFVSTARLRILGKQYCEGAPDLIVEILLPGTWDYDRKEKYQAYQAAGVREYWIVDPRAQVIEVYVLEEGQYLLIGKWGAGERAQSQVLKGFDVAVDDICRE
jgi:Uma2 family endonuclease